MDPIHVGIEVRVGAGQVHLAGVVIDGARLHRVEVVDELLRAGHLRQLRRGGDAGFDFDIDLGLGFGAAPGGDQHDAVGAAHAVEGGGRGVFEDGEGGDVFHIYEVHRAFDAVHQDQGIGVGAEGVDAADPEFGAGARFARVLDGYDAGEFAGEAGGELADRGLELVCADGGDGADDAGFALGAVGDHDDFFELVGLGDQLEAQAGLAPDFQFEVIVAEEAGDEPVGGFDFQGEAAVVVGHRAAGFPFDGDEGARYGSSGLVQHDAADFPVLGEGESAQAEAEEGGEDA